MNKSEPKPLTKQLNIAYYCGMFGLAAITAACVCTKCSWQKHGSKAVVSEKGDGKMIFTDTETGANYYMICDTTKDMQGDIYHFVNLGDTLKFTHPVSPNHKLTCATVPPSNDGILNINGKNANAVISQRRSAAQLENVRKSISQKENDMLSVMREQQKTK